MNIDFGMLANMISGTSTPEVVHRRYNSMAEMLGLEQVGIAEIVMAIERVWEMYDEEDAKVEAGEVSTWTPYKWLRKVRRKRRRRSTTDQPAPKRQHTLPSNQLLSVKHLLEGALTLVSNMDTSDLLVQDMVRRCEEAIASVDRAHQK